MQKVTVKKLYRPIDANFNRAKEGLRVCEDICRFIYDKKALTRRYKDLRHQLTAVVESLKIVDIIKSRDTTRDVGRGSTSVEFDRKHVNDIFYANSQRIKESIRVLEEFTKILNKNKAKELKLMRYKIYALEKTVIKEC